MSAPAAKAEQPKAPAPADRSAPLQSDTRTFSTLSDDRPVAAAHRQQQALISNSPRMQRAAAQQTLIAQSPRQQAAQLRAVAPSAGVSAPAKRNTTGLSDQLKAGVENLSGYSLDDVQVHYNSAKPAQLQAHAYAQGSEIHVAPGQEKHLPHEAWHVVQQKQGRVKATTQLKGVGLNEEHGLEKEADVMGSQAAQETSSASTVSGLRQAHVNGGSLQLRNAVQANLTAGYAENNEAPLYNNTRVPKGNIYEITLQANADTITSVMLVLTAELGRMGAATAAITYLDKGGNPPQTPSTQNWQIQAAGHITTVRVFMASLDGFNWAANAEGKEQAAAFYQNWTGNRGHFRNDAAIGLVDPFIARITVQTPDGQQWVYEVNFSNSANTYITAITDPTLDRRAVIRPVADFLDEHALMQPDKPLIYSAGHTVSDLTIGEQLDRQGTAGTRGARHERLDAQTKIAAEGARFIPIRTAGTALQSSSRFYGSIPVDEDGTYRFVNYTLLTNRWGQWFNLRFNITAAAILAVVDQHGEVVGVDANLIPRPGVDYDLQNDRMF